MKPKPQRTKPAPPAPTRRSLQLKTNQLLEHATATTRGGEHGALGEWQAELQAAHKLRRKVTRYKFESELAEGNCARDLQELPAEGEQLHYLLRGMYSAFDVIPTVINLAGCPAKRAIIATLSFNRRYLRRLLELIDAGQILNVDPFLVSVFWQAHDKGSLAPTAKAELEARGCTWGAARTHAKVFGVELVDGRAFTIEGSGNLASCRMVEQFTLTQSPAVFQFHQRWMAELQRYTD